MRLKKNSNLFEYFHRIYNDPLVTCIILVIVFDYFWKGCSN